MADREKVDSEIFAILRKTMAAAARDLHVKEDTETNYTLVTKSASWKGQPMFFGAVIRKSYVSYHLMPLYWKPALLEQLSPELRKRMQGKSCFNFKKIDAALFAELAVLTRTCLEAYREGNLL